MNVTLLIDAVVRQTTVLIAQLATAGGARAPLAHTANQVFTDLVGELKDLGLGNKVIADMFGLSLRTYHNKVARLSESSTDRGRSLWEALLSYAQERGTVTRSEVLRRFRNDEDEVVRGVLNDLVTSGTPDGSAFSRTRPCAGRAASGFRARGSGRPSIERCRVLLVSLRRPGPIRGLLRVPNRVRMHAPGR